MASVVCLGELLVDMVSGAADVSLHEAPSFLKAPGGAPANVAVGVARLGKSAAFVGKVGADPFGEWLTETLSRENVDVSHLLQSATARTTIAFVATRSDGSKDICFYRNPGADALLELHEIEAALYQGAQIFHCGSVALSCNPTRDTQLAAARDAKARGLLISFDPNWRPSLWENIDDAHAPIWEMMRLSDVVKVADEEWEFITGSADVDAGVARIFEAGARLLFMTRGKNGAAWFASTRGGEILRGEVAGHDVKAIDTLGAGDAFVAGLLTQLCEYSQLDEVLNESALQKIARFANACGALATQTAGAIPSLPSRAQVEDFLR